MNDRYLYRAKRKKDGKQTTWNAVTGIHGLERIEDDTICQCTEINDKNGKLIWENDIVKGKYYDNGKSHRHIGQVKYIYEAYKVVGVKQYTGYHAHLDGSYEVIGNIFDNKELLESEDKNENNY